MNTLTPQTTVGEIAALFPASVRLFERAGIDYCCGGGMALDRACLSRGLDPAGMLAEIEHSAGRPAGSEPDWQSASLSDLIDHIVETHHVYLQTHLPRLEAMLEKVLSKHSQRHGEVLLPLAGTFRPMREELDMHLMKEEHVLFPLIRSLEKGRGGASHCGSVKNPIGVMVMEHDSAGDALARMRELTAGYAPPDDACNTFRALYLELAEMERDLHRHIHLENNILFPRAAKLEAGESRPVKPARR